MLPHFYAAQLQVGRPGEVIIVVVVVGCTLHLWRLGGGALDTGWMDRADKSYLFCKVQDFATSALSQRKGRAPQPSITLGGGSQPGGGVLHTNDNDNDAADVTL